MLCVFAELKVLYSLAYIYYTCALMFSIAVAPVGLGNTIVLISYTDLSKFDCLHFAGLNLLQLLLLLLLLFYLFFLFYFILFFFFFFSCKAYMSVLCVCCFI